MSSVCPSACNVMQFGSEGLCTGLKLVPAFSRQASSYGNAENVKKKKIWDSNMRHQSQRKREREFYWDTKASVHWFMAHYLLLRTWEDRYLELCLSCLSGLHLGAFINSTQKNRICIPAIRRRKLAVETGLTVCQLQFMNAGLCTRFCC